MFKQILFRAVPIAVVYAIVLLLISNDYSQDNLFRVVVQGAVFAVVFGLAVWLLERWKSGRDKRE